MSAPLPLPPSDPAYPSRLRQLTRPPLLWTRGGPLEADLVVGIVGSRKAHPDARAFAEDLAGRLAALGALVVSGGALGIDAAAHGGALAAGGRTWVVAGTGAEHCFPPEHEHLFAAVARSAGAMIWPFPPDTKGHTGGFLARNKLLAQLADVLVVVQAGVPSGALRAAACALSQGKPLWVPTLAPWHEGGFEGSRLLLARGALPLSSTAAFLDGLPWPPGARSTAASGSSAADATGPGRPLGEAESAVLRAATAVPTHRDALALRAGLPAGVASVALLTLALENVVVEGPEGFYRLRNASNA